MLLVTLAGSLIDLHEYDKTGTYYVACFVKNDGTYNDGLVLNLFQGKSKRLWAREI